MLALRLLVVPAALCVFAACSSDSTGSSTPPPAPPTGNATTDINIPPGASVSGQFQPNPKSVALNGGASVSVRWVNRDYSGADYSASTVTHHIVSGSNPEAFAPSQLLTASALTYTISLTAPGDYPYHCSIHPNMQGTIHVDP